MTIGAATATTSLGAVVGVGTGGVAAGSIPATLAYTGAPMLAIMATAGAILVFAGVLALTLVRRHGAEWTPEQVEDELDSLVDVLP